MLPAFPCLELEGNPEQPPLLVLLGLPSSIANAQSLLERIAAGRRTLAISPTRSSDDSDPDAEPSSWPELVAWLVAELDARGFDRVDVLGWSFGGAWALQAIAQQPERFERAIVAATTARFRARERGLLGLLQALLATPIDDAVLHAGLLPMLFSPDFLHRPGAFALLRMHLSKLTASREQWARQLDILRDHDVRAQLSSMHAIDLVIAGRDDWLFPASESRLLAASLPAARLVELPAGHALWFETVDQFVELVHECLDAPRQRGAMHDERR